MQITAVAEKIAAIREAVLLPLENFLDGVTTDFRKDAYSKVAALVFEVCQKHDEALYNSLVASVEAYYGGKVSSSMHHLQGEELLRSFIRHGENQELMARFYKNQFEYLGRNYIKRKKVRPLDELIREKFQNIFYEGLKESLSTTLLAMIQRDREGTAIDKELLTQAVKIITTLGSRRLICYENDIEKPFLQQSRVYYNGKSSVWLASDSVAEFLRKVDDVLKAEKRRVTSFLHIGTDFKLSILLETELLRDKVIILLDRENTGFRFMLEHDRDEDMGLFYRFIIRIGQGSEEMSKIFREHIFRAGDTLWTARRQKEATWTREKGDLNDDGELVKAFIDLHQKYLKLTEKRFASHPKFMEAVKRAFQTIINNDSVKVRFVDILAVFTDKCLKTAGAEKLEESALESLLIGVLDLFPYLVDKDVFRALYRTALAQRLMNQTSTSDDLERLVVGRLKLQCGQEYTSNFECMLFDISNSREQDKDFQEFLAKNPAPGRLEEFSIQVLTLGHWPTYQNFTSVPLPPILNDAMSLFTTYYMQKSDGKRIVWVHELGNCVVRGQWGKRAYALQLAPLQAVVLMHFNDLLHAVSPASETTTFAALATNLQIDEEILRRVLDSLTFGKHKLLLRDRPITSGRPSKAEDVFQVNRDFVSKVTKFKVALPSLTIAKTAEKVEEDRKFAIEACIVRIMKARKHLEHQQLISEVLAQLHLFRPNPSFVRKTIESLIERDYLERDPEVRAQYRYVAEAR